MRHRRAAAPAVVIVTALILAIGSGSAIAGLPPAARAAPPAPAAGAATPPAGAPSWLTAADVADGVPTPASLAAVRAGLPVDPVQATDDLVAAVFGPDRPAAISATGEILRRAGLPLVSALGPVVAMPDGTAVITAPIQVEFIPMLTDSVRGGVFYTPNQVSDLLQYVVSTPKPFTGAQIVGILDQWGKGPGDPQESVVAGSAVRALGAQRHQLLIPSMVVDAATQSAVTDHPDTVTSQQFAELTAPARLIGLDPLQVLLLLAHATAREASGARGLRRPAAAVGTPNGLRRPAASTGSPCPDTSSEWRGAAKAEGKGQIQGAIQGAIGRSGAGEVGAEAFGKASEAVDKVEEVIATSLLVLGAHIDIESDKAETHFRHQSGDTSRNVHLKATASFHSPIDNQSLSCWAFAGIDVPPNGPLEGYRIRWAIDGSPDVLDVVSADANKVQDGEVTGADGSSTLQTYPMTEGKPPQPGDDQPEQTVPQTVVASLSKDDFPFHLKDLVGISEGGPYAAAAKELVGVMEGLVKKVGLPSASTTVQVTYHGIDPYVAKGDSSVNVYLAQVQLHADLYSCKGPDGPWKGTAELDGQFAEIYKIFGKPTSGALKGTVSFSLNPASSSPQTFVVKPKFLLKITLDPGAVHNAEHPPMGAGGSDRLLGGAVIGTGTWIVNGVDWSQVGLLSASSPEFQIKTTRQDPRCPGSSLSDDFFDPYG